MGSVVDKEVHTTRSYLLHQPLHALLQPLALLSRAGLDLPWPVTDAEREGGAYSQEIDLTGEGG